MDYFHQQLFLLVEDHRKEASSTRSAFVMAGIENPLRVVAMDDVIPYYKGTASYANRALHPLPFALIFDLPEPTAAALDLLRWLRQCAVAHRPVIIVLTAMPHVEDADRVYQLGANYLMGKPTELKALAKAVRCLHDWLLVYHSQSLPSNHRTSRS